MILMPPHLLTNFEIQKYYKNRPHFNVVYSRNNSPKKRMGHKQSILISANQKELIE